MYDYNNVEPERLLTKDEMLDDMTLYWENPHTILSAAAEKTHDSALPVAITVFPGETDRAPETWERRAYRTHLLPRGRPGRPLRGLGRAATLL
jgi:hypothetical protein